MEDLIDRQAILQSLEESRQAAKEWKNEAKNEEMRIRAEQAEATFVEAMIRIKDQPFIDAVEVVRCKDCRFYTSMIQGKNPGICSLASRHLGDDGFCSEGERREG